MDDKVIPVVVCNSIEYYKESDMLKKWSNPEAFDPNKIDCLAMEHSNPTEQEISGYWISYCYNSRPTYARAQKIAKGNKSWMSVCSGHKGMSIIENGTQAYDKPCPKVAWGLCAYLLSHGVEDDSNLCYVLSDKYYDAISMGEQYYNEQYTIYRAINEKRYKKYEDLGETLKVEELDIAFLDKFVTDEQKQIERTRTNATSLDIPYIESVCDDASEYINNLYNREYLDCDSVEATNTPPSKVEKNRVEIAKLSKDFIYVFYNEQCAEEFVQKCKGVKAKTIATMYRTAAKCGNARPRERGFIKILHDELSRLRLVSVKYDTFKSYF